MVRISSTWTGLDHTAFIALDFYLAVAQLECELSSRAGYPVHLPTTTAWRRTAYALGNYRLALDADDLDEMVELSDGYVWTALSEVRT